ncbi:hypothetical protein [Candidatus Endomicrobiellum trichonymphae]|nr:hypothetical protein [Candidatus Endomicrobium trichonymphae]
MPVKFYIWNLCVPAVGLWAGDSSPMICFVLNRAVGIVLKTLPHGYRVK